MFCQACGAKTSADDKFCRTCGVTLSVGIPTTSGTRGGEAKPVTVRRAFDWQITLGYIFIAFSLSGLVNTFAILAKDICGVAVFESDPFSTLILFGGNYRCYPDIMYAKIFTLKENFIYLDRSGLQIVLGLCAGFMWAGISLLVKRHKARKQTS